MKYTYKPQNVCSKKFIAEIKDNIIVDFVIEGGCPGKGHILIVHIYRLLRGDVAQIRYHDGQQGSYRKVRAPALSAHLGIILEPYGIKGCVIVHNTSRER